MVVVARLERHAEGDVFWLTSFNENSMNTSMNTVELLLGFDARVPENEHNWDMKRREQFLIRLDAERPSSTDTGVWPAVFNTGLQPPTCVGHQNLWNDLACLRSSVLSADGAPCRIIAVSVYLPIYQHKEIEAWKDAAGPVAPAVRDPEWPLLGYDISDRWLLSGLSNCGFLPGEEALSFRKKWSNKLNNSHLFDRLENALEFKVVSDGRAPEHGPFFVFGIWAVGLHPGGF